MKLNLGAGNLLMEGYVNHDVTSLLGIDVVHDLNIYPWPWHDNSVEEIQAQNLLEHLNDFIKSLEEIHRILRPGGHCHISVPYWNSWCVAADPTHKRGFHEVTFKFFDPNSIYCKERSYYSHARFNVIKEEFILVPFGPYLAIPLVGEIAVSNKFLKRLIGLIGNYFINNLIHDLRITLEKV
jgi:SAM-dependent methyltransferase